ncbi:CASP-like protein 1E1 [Rhododendron vialii]|uniref:CASP-like protein 1E1 n=1 Tax=Rhododendron vialii TaxID=182163 RepID=UPI00265FDFF6|nr:CASP-like protein 1E1 [Rhododendron vialii]
MDGVEGKSDGGGVQEEASSGTKSGVTRAARSLELVLRVVGMGFSLVAAVMVGVDKETEVVALTVVDTLPPLHVSLTAKWYYMSAFVYFVVANAIACFYAAASLVALSIMPTKKTTQNGLTLALLILDLVMVALLFSANGAAVAVGLIGLHGNSHTNWKKVCNVFKTFCRYMTAGFAMSMMGSFVFLWLVLLGTLSLHKKSS